MERDAAEAVVQVHRTSVARLASTAAVVEDPEDVLRRFGVRDDQRFVLAADGSYDVQLIRFFRELDGWGVRLANGSPRTSVL